MATHHDSLVRLGLAPDADERQVRRAYARELKLIDQERDLEGFQHLRACYEAAMQWATSRLAQQEHERTVTPDVRDESTATRQTAQGAPAPAASAPVLEEAQQTNPGVLGDSVFAAFLERVPKLAAHAAARSRLDDAERIAPWSAALHDALADPCLVHLHARVVFEHRIAALLAAGWRPGHERLLAASVDIFGWDQDRSALMRLGQPGALVDAALQQRAMFQTQDIQARTQQREILALLRASNMPGVDVLRRHRLALNTLMQEFPHLLGIVAPHDVALIWRTRASTVVLAPKTAPDMPAPTQRSWLPNLFTRGAFVLALMCMLAGVVGKFIAHDRSQGSAASHFSLSDSAERRERLRHPRPIYEDEPVTKERIEAIRKHIDYRPGPDVPPGEQVAKIQVVLDADGSILGLNKRAVAGDPAFTRAVEDAIRATGPFPPRTSKWFTLSYSTVVAPRRAVPPAARPSPPPWKAMPAPTWTGSGQAHVGAATHGTADPLTAERFEAIRQRIDYRPGKDAPSGPQRVRFEVLLNPDGSILGLTELESPSDPAYAAAVGLAIRSTQPFPPDSGKSFSIGFHTVPPEPVAAAEAGAIPDRD